MMLRWLVTQYVRQAAQQKLRETVVETARQHLGHESPERAAAADEPQEPFVCQAALLFALGIEAGGTIDLLDQSRRQRGPSWTASLGRFEGKQVVVGETGVGRESAAQATSDLIDRFQPPWVISAGFAGALREDLRRGQVLMADSIVDEKGDELSTGFTMDEATRTATRGLHVGRLLTVDRVIREPEQRRTLGETHQALACDMESLAVARVCAERKVRFLAVRVISDAMEDVLPPEIEKLISPSSLAGKLGMATGALFRRPSVVKDMWKLRETAMETSDRLARFLTGVVKQLDG